MQIRKSIFAVGTGGLMKLSYGSKRANLVREVLYACVMLRAFDKLDNYSFVAVIVGVVGGYLANRWLTDKKLEVTK